MSDMTNLTGSVTKLTQLDSSLTKEGYSADAKATGEAIKAVAADLANAEKNIAESIETNKEELTENIEAVRTAGTTTADELSALKTQVTNLVVNAGDTGNNAELVDIRVGANGETYKTAGEAVRKQLEEANAGVTDLKSDLSEFSTDITNMQTDIYNSENIKIPQSITRLSVTNAGMYAFWKADKAIAVGVHVSKVETDDHYVGYESISVNKGDVFEIYGKGKSSTYVKPWFIVDNNYNIVQFGTSTTEFTEIVTSETNGFLLISWGSATTAASLHKIEKKYTVKFVDNRYIRKSRMKFGAHRGARYYAPENSIPAYIIAGQQGWEWAWITGIQISADGTMYIMHDDTVDRTTDGSGEISTMTDEEVNTLRIDIEDGGYEISDFDTNDLYVPTLEEVLQICIKYGMKMCIKLQQLSGSYEYGSVQRQWATFKKLLDSYNIKNSDCCFYGSATQHAVVRTVFGEDAECCYYGGGTATAQDGLDYFSNNGIDGNRSMIISTDVLDLESVKLLHLNGIRVYAYATNPSDELINNCALWGVDILQNDRMYFLP